MLAFPRTATAVRFHDANHVLGWALAYGASTEAIVGGPPQVSAPIPSVT